jgi:uncharacterized membrane protein YhaH (DUF805 family)
MTLLLAIRAGFRNYAQFSGRAGRPEFWWWILFTALVGSALGAIPLPVFQYPDGTLLFAPALSPVWHLVVLLPTLGVTVRRLRDASYSWGHIFLVLLPVVGPIILAVLCAQPADQRQAARPTRTVVTDGAPV